MDGQEPLSLRPGHDLGRPPGPLTFETLGSFSTMAQMPAWPCAKLPFFSHGSKSPKGVGGRHCVFFKLVLKLQRVWATFPPPQDRCKT